MKQLDLFKNLRIVPRLDRHLHVPIDPIALDAMFRDELADERKSFDGDVPHSPRVRRPDESRDFRMPRGHAEQRLRAATPGSAPANATVLRAVQLDTHARPDGAPPSIPRCRRRPRTRRNPRCPQATAAPVKAAL